MERLLPLNAVRVFAAVGRLLSFTRAAEELSVTPSAISHQIRILEEHLGAPLIRRQGHRIVLTPQGKLYLQQISEGLLQVSQATRALKAAKGQQILKICAPPSLSALWLMTRISRFMKSHPQIALALTATRQHVDFSHGQYDMAIWYCEGAPSGLRADELCPNAIFPVCNPKLLKARPPLRTPADLRLHTLLDSSDERYYQGAQPGWFGWLQAAGIPEITGVRYLSFTPRALMHQAVLDELGVGLSRTLLAADLLASGKLACPFGPAIPLKFSYYLVSPEVIAARPDIAAFRDWLLEEARTSGSQIEIDRAWQLDAKGSQFAFCRASGGGRVPE